MVAESWFRSLWKAPRRNDHEKELVGVLAFEIASLMSKLVHLWQSLSDKQVFKLTEEIRNSRGIRKLISEDEEFIARLIFSEMIDNMVHVSKSVCRLAKRCSDSTLKNFELLFDDLIRKGVDPCGWGLSSRKMEKKVKKMERFISINGTLYQEMELLGDLEQTVKRLKNNAAEPDNVAEYQKKLSWKRQEIKNLKEVSLWNKSYNYTILLLGRSLFTVCNRINDVFGIQISGFPAEGRTLGSSEYIYRGNSASVLHSPAPSESGSFLKFASGPLNWLSSKTDFSSKSNGFFSGPLSGSNSSVAFLSGPLGKTAGKTDQSSGVLKSRRIWHVPQSPLLWGRKSHMKQVGPLKGIMAANSIASCYNFAGNPSEGGSSINTRCKLLKTLPGTLGAAALALHYANVIIVIEKLAASPHLIGHDARDDLYKMLPANVKTALRARLVPCSRKNLTFDTVLAQEWMDAMASILDWLAPLAHNMIKWQSERSFEQHSFLSRTNVLLVQTLFFANQEKTEAVISELLVGLNYVCRLGREANAKATLKDCASTRTFDEYLEMDN